MTTITENKLFLYFIIFLLGFLSCFLFKGCETQTLQPLGQNTVTLHTETVVHDTIPPDTIRVPMYVKVPGPTKTIRIPLEIHDSSICDYVRVYEDSLRNQELVIYYTDSVIGQLLDKHVSYKLFVPKKIVTTHTIKDSVSFPVKVPSNGVYVSGGMNLDTEGMNNIMIGADFVSKKKWGLSYFYGIPNSQHYATFKWKLN